MQSFVVSQGSRSDLQPASAEDPTMVLPTTNQAAFTSALAQKAMGLWKVLDKAQPPRVGPYGQPAADPIKQLNESQEEFEARLDRIREEHGMLQKGKAKGKGHTVADSTGG